MNNPGFSVVEGRTKSLLNKFNPENVEFKNHHLKNMSDSAYNIIGEGKIRIIERQDFPRLNVTVDFSSTGPEIKNVELIDYDGPEAVANALNEIDNIILEMNAMSPS